MDPKFDINSVRWSVDKYGNPFAYQKINTPGVTTIINTMIPDPEMEDWVRKVGQTEVDKILTSAGHRGTAMHIFIETFLKSYSKNKDISEALKLTQINSPLILLKENIPQNKIDAGRELFYKFYYSDFVKTYAKVIGIELGIYSPTLFYRGKVDIFYMERIFGPTVTDFKTSNQKIKKDSIKELKYKFQLGGYSSALDEMYRTKGLNIKRASILCVNTKTDDLQEIVCEGKELEKYKLKFKTLVCDYHIKNNQEYLIS